MLVPTTRTKEEIEKTIQIISKEINSLPEYNAFGDSNMDDIMEIKGWVKELQKWQYQTNISIFDPKTEVEMWMVGKWSALNDYK